MQNADFDQDNTGSSESLKDQARSLGQDAKAAASKAGAKVKSTVREGASNIGGKARNVASETGRKLENKLREQRDSGADYLQNVASLVHEAAGVFDQEVPQASHYIHQAAEQIDTVAEAVRTKSMREVTHDVEDFARRQPAIFLGGAMLLGFAAVRLVKAAPAPAGSTNNPPGGGL